MQNKLIHYFVEGECEKKFIDSFKIDPYNAFVSGKVSVFNVIKRRITINRLMTLNPKTIIILVYDIDVLDTHILEENIKLLKKYKFKDVYHIHSIQNFEDELVYASNLKKIDDLFGTKCLDDFKSKFINHKDIIHKLDDIGFDVNKMWSRKNINPPFNQFSDKKSLELIKKI